MQGAFLTALAVLAAVGALADGGGAVQIDLLETTTLSITSSTRGTAYSPTNKIVTIGASTHVAWLDSVADIMVATYYHQRGRWSEPVRIGVGVDNHSGPALCSDSEGYLHCVFGPHHGDLQYAVSARPNDSSSWVQQPRFGDHATYPSLVCDRDDTLHIAYRGSQRPTKLLYQRKPKGGEWSEPIVLVDPAVPDGYTQFGNALYVHSDGTLHLGFHIYDMHPAAGKAVGYLRSVDGGDTWTLADGSAVSLPYTPDQPGWIEQGPDLDMRVLNVVCDAEGAVYLGVSHYETKPEAVVLWVYRDGRWTQKPLMPAIHRLRPGAHAGLGAMTFDSAGNLYIVTTTSMIRSWAGKDGETVLLVSGDGGETFTAVQLSDDGGEVGNWLENIERPGVHNRVEAPFVIYTHGAPGGACDDGVTTEIRCVRVKAISRGR